MMTTQKEGDMPMVDDEYPAGSVKFNPKTGSIAIRTTFNDDDATACTSWLSVTPASGARYLTAAQVADWIDVELPEVAKLNG